MDAPARPIQICLFMARTKKHNGEEDLLGVAGCHLAERLHDERLPTHAHHTKYLSDSSQSHTAPPRRWHQIIQTIPTYILACLTPASAHCSEVHGSMDHAYIPHWSNEQPTCWHSLVEATSKGVRRWTGAWVPACRTSAPARSSALPRHQGRKMQSGQDLSRVCKTSVGCAYIGFRVCPP
jgi:hypothetical protein